MEVRMLSTQKVVAISIVIMSLMAIYSLHSTRTEQEVELMPNENTQALGAGEIKLQVPFEEALKGPIGMPQDHPMLVKHIQKSLDPPSEKALNLKNRTPSRGQDQEIINIIGEMRGEGFFVEAGANDGETASNTLKLEKEFGWKGLLVEGNPVLYKKELLLMNRKAWSINSCLSMNPYPNVNTFYVSGVWGKVVEDESTLKADVESAQVQCFPLYSIMLALNRTTIDYFSLDVEGYELDILKTIPWEKLNIRTLSVEFQNIKRKSVILNKAERDVSLALAGKEELSAYMESVGYNVYTDAGEVNQFIQMKGDLIFYRKDVVPLKPSNYTPQ